MGAGGKTASERSGIKKYGSPRTKPQGRTDFTFPHQFGAED